MHLLGSEEAQQKTMAQKCNAINICGQESKWAKNGRALWVSEKAYSLCPDNQSDTNH